MLQLPGQLIARYQSHLAKGGIKDANLVECLKWLRFFLDYCHKYKVSGAESHCMCQWCSPARRSMGF